MTYRELMEEVAHLGFDSAVEDLASLATATNRALAQLHRELRPATEDVVVTVREPILAEYEERVIPNGAEIRIKATEGVAVSFESIGGGNISFEKEGEILRDEVANSTEWKGRRYLYLGQLGADLLLRGRTDFAVRSLAVFSMADNTAEASALPVMGKNFASFDLSAVYGDFLSLDSTPYTEAGIPVRGYEIENNILRVPSCVRGRVQVGVRRKLRLATLDHFESAALMDTEIDIHAEYADILPLCVASYVWADVEPEKAAYYKQMCDEQVRYAKLQQQHRGRARVYDRKGWR